MIYRSRDSNIWDDRRQAMIDEHSAWLTWAQDNKIPVKIPRRRVDEGGYSELLNLPGARAAVTHWWYRTLGAIARLGERD